MTTTPRDEFTAKAEDLADQVGKLIEHPGRIPADMPNVSAAFLHLQALARRPQPKPMQSRPACNFHARSDISSGLPPSDRLDAQERA